MKDSQKRKDPAQKQQTSAKGLSNAWVTQNPSPYIIESTAEDSSIAKQVGTSKLTIPLNHHRVGRTVSGK